MQSIYNLALFQTECIDSFRLLVALLCVYIVYNWIWEFNYIQQWESAERNYMRMFYYLKSK